MNQTEASACLAPGAVSSWTRSGATTAASSITLVGRGVFLECEAAVLRVLGSFDAHDQPVPHPGQRFVAMSLFFYAVQVRAFCQPASTRHSPKCSRPLRDRPASY